MSAKDKLHEYRARRDFAWTSEPAAGDEAAAGGRAPIFVIQEHAASHHHFDFRLEADGVLVSFAVPKGPSLDPSERRLAVRTEDHPLAYAGFEGTIPEGQYGAGAVIVWDRGGYENVSEKDGRQLTMAEALDKGHVRVRLSGQKLRGVFSLIHARLGGEDKNWLLMKEKGEGADARRRPARTQPESVASGRTLAEVAAAAGKKGTGGSRKHRK
jgi:DNA ligase D-like protein (predicted 3'-phosphoesterase)